ncbi:MAG: 16S rRNA (uracil(1498)-N(3))-methyltransferase, partial [Acinetobacter sp.]
MNIVLIEPEAICSEYWRIDDVRQVQHLQQHLNVQVGDCLKVGIRNGKRYLTKIIDITNNYVLVSPLHEEEVPAKLPVHLILALPRPKVLRRVIMDSVTLGVD